MADPAAITVDQYLAHSPAKVWQALTDAERMARWLMPNDFEPVVGHRFTFRTEPRPQQGFDGIVHCQVLDVEFERLLRISWRGGRLNTTVTWTLKPEGHGTRLFLEHVGFDPDDPIQQQAFVIMGGGWRSRVFAALERELAAV